VELAELGDDEQATTPAPKWAESHCKILLLNPFRVLPFLSFSTTSFTGGYSYFVLSGHYKSQPQNIMQRKWTYILKNLALKSQITNVNSSISRIIDFLSRP